MADDALVSLSDQRQAILDRIANGELTVNVIKELGTTPGTFYRLLEADPLFAEAYKRAREVALRMMAEGLATIHDDVPDVQRARLASENRRWLLERQLRKDFGASIEVNQTQTVEIGPLLAAAQARKRALYRPATDQQVIEDAQVVDSQAHALPSTNDKQSVREPLPELQPVAQPAALVPKVPGLDDLLG